jgi:hypothetical protein
LFRQVHSSLIEYVTPHFGDPHEQEIDFHRSTLAGRSGARRHRPERGCRSGAIFSATGATINAGGPGFGSIADTFNQAGLSAGYTSGTTDFDAYVLGTTHSIYFT